MKALLGILLFGASVAQADMWTLYDGDGTIVQPHNGSLSTFSSQAGVSCGFYNSMLSIPWRKKGGDWIDANGVMHGAAPLATAFVRDNVLSTAPVQVSLDVTSMIGAEGVILRLPAARQTVVRIGMREHATYMPVLEVTTADGVINTPITADAALQFVDSKTCSVTANQKFPSGSINPTIVMGLQWPAGAISAKLHVWVVESSSGSTTLEAYRMVVPRIETSQANVVPVSPNPRIIWQQDFNGVCPKYWEGLGYTNYGTTPGEQWTVDPCPGERYGWGSRPGQSGMYRANGDGMILAQGTTDLMVPRLKGWNNTNGLGVIHHPTQLGSGVEMPNVKISALAGGELDEAWFRFMVYFDESFHTFKNSDGGKLPGFKGNTDYCAGSGVKANGYCGWSLRNGFRITADPQNPGFGHVRVDTYAYHAEQTDFTGSSWAGDYRALVPLGKWACVEQHVKVNTPGVKDGVNQVYIDGVLVLDKQDMYLRGPHPSTLTGNPAHGYGDWWLTGAGFPTEPAGAPRITDPVTGRVLFWGGAKNISGNLGIDAMYWVQHGGGGQPIGKPGVQQAFDEFVISHERAGCPIAGDVPPPPPPPPPPPVEVCGDGIDNDQDGQIDEGCAPPPPPPVEICDDGLDNDSDGQIDEGCAPPPPTELEAALEALRQANAALAEALGAIDVLRQQAVASAAQINELRAAADASAAQIEDLKAAIDIGTAQVTELQAVIVAAQAKAASVRQAIRTLLDQVRD